MLATPARYYHPRLLELSRRRTSRAGAPRASPARSPTHAGERLLHPPSCSATPTSSTRSPAGRACPWLHRVSQPTLVVSGEDDPSVPLRNGRLLAARLPDARLHVVPGGGHLFLLDEPEHAAPVIRAFLDED